MIPQISLPFPCLFFRHWYLDGSEMGVLVVRAVFDIREGRRAVLPKEQPEMVLSDIFSGEANLSSLKQESEIAPFKPKTDLTFSAIARSPEEKSLESWPVRVDIARPGADGGMPEVIGSHGFHVFGERLMEPEATKGGKRWRLSSVAPVKEVPLTYEHAYGGTVKIDEESEDTHVFNPVGRGMVSDYLLEAGEALPAPQIGLVGEFAAWVPGTEMTVCGIAPLTKSWQPRLALAGTFDDAWLRERHPRMPADYGYGFWNAAPQALQFRPFLTGMEQITVHGMRHDPAPYRFCLPEGGLKAVVRYANADDRTLVLRLDTVHCDIADPDPEKHVMTLVWRQAIENPDDVTAIEILPHALRKETS
ncbi:DUF2169 family type VI secretion system accessory protein [Martelella soudanensis]|uniref:DUF2169 family type VI secretion system accessory protein n=1 Tax=unclassified Martelella TaxID=2629616 RepID=UPI0015DE9F02|nr:MULTISPECIES: DUF2169 domain-containing protein [unclassified Martelella]